MSAELKMKVSAETNAAQQALNQLSEKLDSLGPSKMQQIAAGVAVVTSAFRAAKTVIGTVVNVSKELIDTYRVQEQAEARLQAVLKATGSQIGITASDMLELASAVQSYTRFGDEAVIEAEKLLLATQSLDKDGLERAIAASADLAEAFGIDIVSAASTMAYALQDPEQGLTRLRRQGIAFTDEEYEQVKALQEANDLYGAQAVVLEKIESRYKGVSKAVADTPTGTLDKIKNVWGDIKENLGEGIVRALSPAFDWLLKQLNKVSEWTKDKNDKANFNSLLSSGSYEQLGQSFSGEYLREQERIILEDYYDSLGQLRRSEIGQILSRGLSFSLDEIVRKDSNEISKILNDALTSIYGEGDFSYAIRGYADAIENFRKNQISALDTIEKAISYSDQQKNANINTFADFVPGSALSGDASVAGVTETSAIDSFLKQYGRSSLSYQASEYQKIIDQAKELRDQMYQPIVPGAGMLIGNTDLMHEWGMDISEFSETYRILGEIIDDVTEKKDNLFAEDKAPAEPGWLPTDYLEEYNTQISHLRDQIASLDSQIEVSEGAAKKYLEEIRAGYQGDLDSLLGVEAEPGPPEPGWLPTDYLEEYRKKVSQLESQMSATKEQIDSITDDPAAKEYLQEIYDGLEKDYEQLMNVTPAVDTFKEALKEVGQTAYDTFLSVNNSLASIWTNQANQMKSSMEQMRKDGTLTIEKEQEMQAEIDRLNRKAFEAKKVNSIAEATMSYAQAVMKVWAESGNAVVAGIQTGLLSTAYGFQLASITSQQYVPSYDQGAYELLQDQIAQVHKGEMIIPRPFAEDIRSNGGLGSGLVLNISINGDVVGDVEEHIFNAIERAQRTGALPHWRYA